MTAPPRSSVRSVWSPDVKPGEWYHSIDHGQACRLVSLDEVWGERTVLIWLPSHETVVCVAADRLREVSAAGATSVDHLTFACAAAKIADALAGDTLVAPLEGSLIPLPHQIETLSRAVSGDRIRYLLADEVGLGKTIEAGLILRELKARGRVRRILVVAPAGLVSQWVSEMRTHFGEEFRLVLPGNFTAWRQVAAVEDDENLWRLHDQVVCPLDSVKPMDGRRGWTREQVARFNRERFEDLVSAGWDLIIIDEAHRLGGSTDQVARYRLGEALAQAAPYLLLLSATPHQGKTDAFRRLVGFLDADALPDDESVRRENIAPYVIRTEKRRAIDADGNPLFKPRLTQIATVTWDGARHEQRALYEAVTEYVRDGYNQAQREKKAAIGFLMILMQRLVTSSTAAIRTALERRLQVLQLPQGQLSLFPEDVGEGWVELDGQDQMESLLKSRLKGLKNERAEVELLLSAARRCEARGPDVKTQALLDWMQRLQREENDPSLKVLVFTEFVPTQAMLAEFLGERGYAVACLNGSMGLEERKEAQRAFANESQVLVSTDAGGEGLNLQFCHVVVNYDLPWNPMKLEQRIGRVDRIGQGHVVRALNFALQDTVELRVREVLEEKLQRILEEFGVDKLGDVLDSEEGGVDFEDLYVSAVLTPGEAEKRAATLADEIRRRAQAAHEGSRLLSTTAQLDPTAAKRVASHQIPFWVERMTVAWLQGQEASAAIAESDGTGYRLRWPDGTEVRHAVFSRPEARLRGSTHLALEDPRIRALVKALPHFAPGQPIARIRLSGVSDKVAGLWSLWRVALQTPDGSDQRILPVFVADDGRSLVPTARVIWNRLIESHGVVWLPDAVDGADAGAAFARARSEAESQGHEAFRTLREEHEQGQRRERRKTAHAFAARRRVIERVGLAQVRNHRLRQLEQEERQWQAAFAMKAVALAELTAIAMARIEASGGAQ